MRIVISGSDTMKPLELRGVRAVLLSTIDESESDSSPSVAHGTEEDIARMASVTLVAVREHLGLEMFDKIVRYARTVASQTTDITPSVLPGSAT